MTKEELQEAATAIFNAEKNILTQLDDLLSAFQSEIQSLADTMPVNPALNTPVAQLVTRVRSSVTAQFAYEIQNLKVQYGLTSPVSMGAPTV